MALGTWAESPEDRAVIAKAKQIQVKLREYKEKPPSVAVIRAFAEDVKKAERDIRVLVRNDASLKSIEEELSKFTLTLPAWVKRSKEADAKGMMATTASTAPSWASKPRTPEMEAAAKAIDAHNAKPTYHRGEGRGSPNPFKAYKLTPEQGAALQAALEGKKFAVLSSTTVQALIRGGWLEKDEHRGERPTQKAKDAWAKIKAGK